MIDLARDAEGAAPDVEVFCPECGKPFSCVLDTGFSRPPPSRAWLVILTAIGVVLSTIAGWQIGTTQVALAAARGQLVERIGCAWDDRTAARCDAIFSRRAAVLDARLSSDEVKRLWEQQGVEGVLGVIALLVGVGGLLSRRRSHLPAVGGAWAVVEVWVISGIRVLLLLLGLAVVARLVQGVAPSWDLLDGAINRLVGVIVDAVLALVG